MGVFDRIGQVVKSEWSHRFRRDRVATPPRGGTAARTGEAGGRPVRAVAVTDVEGALRVLELSGTPTLPEVRARYRELSRRYWPKTTSPGADEAHAAAVVVDALTDALELLEEHLLPLS